VLVSHLAVSSISRNELANEQARNGSKFAGVVNPGAEARQHCRAGLRACHAAFQSGIREPIAYAGWKAGIAG
jgi:hypothetical protein